MSRSVYVYLFGLAAIIIFFFLEVVGDPDPLNGNLYSRNFVNVVFISAAVFVFIAVGLLGYRMITSAVVGRIDYILLVTSGIAIVIIYSYSFNAILAPNGDNAEYIINAISLVQKGGAFRLDTPNETPNTLAAVGLPLILSPIYRLWGLDFIKMKYLIMTMGLCLMPLLFLLFRKSLHFYPSAILTVVSFSSPYLVANATTIMTETPYLLWSSAALLFAHKFAESNSFKIIDYLILLILLLMTVATRILGVSVILAVCIFMTLKIPWLRMIKEGNLWSSYRINLRKTILIVLPTLFALVFWQWQQSQIGLAPWRVFFDSGIGTHVRDNFISLSNVFGKAILSADTFRWYRQSPDHLLAPFNVWWLVISFIIVIGLIRELTRGKLLALYTLTMLFLLLLASSTPQERVTLRYISVLIPYFFYHFYLGFSYLIGEVLNVFYVRKSMAAVKMMSLLGLIFILGTNLNGNSYNVFTKSAVYNAWYSSFLEAARWCGKNLPPDAYVMSVKPRIVYLYSGLKGTFLVNERDSYSKTYEQEKLNQIKSGGITHIIVDAISNATKNNFYPILENNPDKFRALTVPGLEGKCTVVEVLDW